MSDGALAIRFGGEDLVLLPERAVLWPRLGTLLIADAHVGKGAFFRRHAIPVPAGSSRGTLDRLGQLVRTTKATRIVSLGDFLHAPPSEATLALLDDWRRRYRNVVLDLLPGNHDRHLDAVLGGPWRRLDEPRLDAFRLLHEPEPVTRQAAAGFAFAGHLHPVVVLAAGRADRLRCPAFVVQGGQLILPAFGEFTGGWRVHPEDAERVWVIGDGAVVAI